MGGRVFKGTSLVNGKAVGRIVDSFNLLFQRMSAKLYLIGSCYNMADDATSGDIDTLVSEKAICKHFNVKTSREARKCLKKYFEDLGFESALSGSTVHVKIMQEQKWHQIDIMFVDHPEEIAVFHRHQIPANSIFKGFHKQMALFWLARNQGLCWSAFQGLYTRDKNGKRSNLLTVDADYVAWILLGGNATAKDLSSYEAILSALDKDVSEQMQQELAIDPSWEKFNEIH